MSEAKLSAVIRDPTGQAELELPSRVVDQFSVDQTLNFLVKLNLQSVPEDDRNQTQVSNSVIT